MCKNAAAVNLCHCLLTHCSAVLVLPACRSAADDNDATAAGAIIEHSTPDVYFSEDKADAAAKVGSCSLSHAS